MAARHPFLHAIVTGIILSAHEKAQCKSSDLNRAARGLVELLDTKDFDAKMQKVLPAEAQKRSWQRVLDQAGTLKKLIGSGLENPVESRVGSEAINTSLFGQQP
jgi:hypothetical protein